MVILDIGSNDGSNGLAFAMLNPNINVYSFEPNPYLKKVILGNKRKIEKRFRIYLKNFFFIGEAVSNKDEKKIFYITKNDATSSLLKPRKKLHKYWTRNEDVSIKKIADWVKIKKKINQKL